MAAIFAGATVTTTTTVKGKTREVTGTVLNLIESEDSNGRTVIALIQPEGASPTLVTVLGTSAARVTVDHLSGAPSDVTDGASEDVYGHDAKTMREWLRAEGVEGVGTRGRINPQHAALFLAAHPA